jgi:hypothetical protein
MPRTDYNHSQKYLEAPWPRKENSRHVIMASQRKKLPRKSAVPSILRLLETVEKKKSSRNGIAISHATHAGTQDIRQTNVRMGVRNVAVTNVEN